MRIKKVDTAGTFGRAEQYLQTTDDFKRFLREKYKENELRFVDEKKLVEKYNLKAVVFGNYLTQVERHFYLFKIQGQLKTLAEIRGNNDLGKGILTISFGGHGIGGNAMAHFSPKENLINLTRGSKSNWSDFMKGENSFVHEYGHFIDFIQGYKVDKSLFAIFASENENPDGSNANTQKFAIPVDILYSDVEYMAKLKTPYLRSRIEVFARLFEAGITAYVHKNLPDEKRFFDREYTEYYYYPKEKIYKLGLDDKMAGLLKLN